MIEQHSNVDAPSNREADATVVVNTVVTKSNGLDTAGFVLALLGLLVSWPPESTGNLL